MCSRKRLGNIKSLRLFSSEKGLFFYFKNDDGCNRKTENSLWSQVDEAINVSKVEEQIANLKPQTMALIAECTATHTIAEKHDILKAMSDEIRELQTMLDQYKESGTVKEKIHKEVEEVKIFLENDTHDYEDYDDVIIRLVMRQIKVYDDGKLQILFNCGRKLETTID